ncbi:CHAP domain-containing protein [Streptomyces calvus]|uniref:Surface antigen n=1 Tax=Streptomyces calvus TaxID=67282 RepID=A0AA40SKJ2_9ACTN|nr:CHAP domain-containing protein [Streptomyces calvus]MBA8948206.1 surface antigen [Streptomyces calvus]GGP83879.1 hypothetical protein GCM10010247_66550 [Streptomyces calvus]
MTNSTTVPVSGNTRIVALALSALLAGGLAVSQAQAAPAEPAIATAAATGEKSAASASSLALTRQQIVARAEHALKTPTKYRTAKNGPIKLSTPKGNNNYLGGHNLNVYNNYNGQSWCGHFAAAMWGKQGVPAKYEASQRWRTHMGNRFHPYRVNRLPQPGDVLVWTNTSNNAFGHVGVVVSVKGRSVTTIEGNAGAGTDSVTRQTYSWDDKRATGGGPYLPSKKFAGFASAR